MSHLPIDDIAIDLARAQAAVAQQFPSLAKHPMRQISGGWDNLVFAVGDRLAFRFPRRHLAVAGVLRECEVLPRLVSMLPAAIPNPCFIGRPCAAFPHPFFGYEFIAGRELLMTPLSPTAADYLARQLGGFLAALHHEDPASLLGVSLPEDVHGPLCVSRLREKAGAFLRMLPASARVDGWRRAVEQDVRAGDERPLPRAEYRLVHGDLHLRHALVLPTGALSGIIDWGDLHLGHPAIDLSLYWSALAPAQRPSLAAAYGPLPETWLRFARAMGAYSCAALAAHACDEGRHEAQRAAECGLDRCFA